MIEVVGALNFLANGGMITEAMQCGRRYEKENIASGEACQLPQSFVRDVVDAELIDENELRNIRIEEQFPLGGKCSIEVLRFNLDLNLRELS